MSNDLTIVRTGETIFFSHYQDVLREWIQVTLLNGLGENVEAEVKITAGDEEVTTSLVIAPGEQVYRCYAPVLWPHKPAETHAPVALTAGTHRALATVSVGTHRPWVVYLLADVCTDATWVYANFKDARKDDADLTYAELLLAESTRSSAPENINHYNLVHALELDNFEEFYPEHKTRLVDAIRRGEITLNPFLNMTLTQNVSLEEQIRHFYVGRRWAVEYNLEMAYANHQETPSISWDMPGLLEGSGVRHLIKAILPYECPWVARLGEPPLFLWEGPDGSRILYRRRNWDYVEGKFVLKGLEATDAALHNQIIPEYEGLRERYPFNALSLLGCYGDLIPAVSGKLQSRDLPLMKAATIASYNARDWEYPRLVNASHKQFWDDIEAQISERDIQLEVYRGDYGTGWDAWPACMSLQAAQWRRAQERAGLADKLSAVLSILDPQWFAENRTNLQAGWRNLSLLADHAWNGANDANRELNAALRKEWASKANQCFDEVIESGLEKLGKQISNPSPGAKIVVVNGLPWSRDAVVVVENVQEDARVIDIASGEEVPSQGTLGESRNRLEFLARSVPSVGYRIFGLKDGEPGKLLQSPWKQSPNRLEGPFYTVEVSPTTGGIISLYDRERGKELVDPASPYHLNQFLYFSDGPVDPGTSYPLLHAPKVSGGNEFTPSAAKVEFGPMGPVSAGLHVSAEVKGIRIKTTITLYADLDRIDICNEVDKPPSDEKQELDFAFPFKVSERNYHYETPAAIIHAGEDHLPGAGLSTAVLRHFIDVSNDQYGVTLSQADSFVVEFGHRTTTEDPKEIDLSNSTVLVQAFGSIIDSNEAIRGQAGESHFVFRFSLQGHSGGFDPSSAVRFGWEDNNPLLCTQVPENPSGRLPAESCSFVTVTPESAILTTLKVAEEDGLIARVWECAGTASSAWVKLAQALSPQAAVKTDHLERDLAPLELVDGSVEVPVKPRGISSLRFKVK